MGILAPANVFNTASASVQMSLKMTLVWLLFVGKFPLSAAWAVQKHCPMV